MGKAAHTHHSDHARRSLHRVGLTQNAVDGGLIVGRRLERHQPGGDALEVALGLLDKQRSELVF
jgi:hypothetical protein